MKKSLRFLKHSTLVCASIALFTTTIARAGEFDPDCSPAAKAADKARSRLSVNESKDAAQNVIGTQNLYSCKISERYSNVPQAVFLALVGQRIARLAPDLAAYNFSFKKASAAIDGILRDINDLQVKSNDHSPQLESLRSEIQKIKDMNPVVLTAKIAGMSAATETNYLSALDTHFLDPLHTSFCAYTRVVEASARGSTSGFSKQIINCQ